MIGDHEKLKEDYEKIWQNHLRIASDIQWIRNRLSDRKVYYEIIQKYLDKKGNQTILEIGSGTGIDINIIKGRNEHIKALGSDISEKSIQVGLRVSNEFGHKVAFFAADTNDLPLKDNVISLVFSQGLVEHFRNPQTVISEQVRVLKPGGILIVNVPQKFTGYTRMKRKLIKNGQWHLGWETEFSYCDLKNIGKRLGLNEKEVCSYQYWKSWKEPIFVLRDFYDKMHRKNPLKAFPPFSSLKKVYDSMWGWFERRWGHYFLQNIIIVFQK